MDEAFVYLWRDSKGKKFYLGYHKGSVDDNYAHSSSAMESFNMSSIPKGYKRRILAQGSRSEMIALEQTLLAGRNERGRWEKYHNISLAIHPYMWDDPEFRKTHQERMKVLWDDPEFRAMKSESVKAQWDDPEFRKTQSERMRAQCKKNWKNPEFRKRHAEHVKSQSKDPEYRKTQSKRSKALWADPAYRKTQSEKLKTKWDDPEFKRAQSERMRAQCKKNWKDSKFRKNQSEKMKTKWDDPEFRKKMRGTCSVCGYESMKTSIARWHNERCKHKTD